jgi:protein-tyrosine-phosphatase
MEQAVGHHSGREPGVHTYIFAGTASGDHRMKSARGGGGGGGGLASPSGWVSGILKSGCSARSLMGEEPERVLVICRSNAGRSQIAQAFLRRYVSPSAVRSAGVNVRAEERDGYLLRKDIVDGGLPYALDLSGSRRGQLRAEDLGWADQVIVVMPSEELERLKTAALEGGKNKNGRPGDVDAAGLADWALEHKERVSYWPIKDIRAGEEGESRTPEKVAETYAEIDQLARGWVQERKRQKE